MKKFILILILIVLSIAIGLNWNRNQTDNIREDDSARRAILLRFALVSDSENENDLLSKALNQAKGAGVNFVIGLGDFSSVGTLDQLKSAKEVFDKSGLTYYITPGDRDLWDSRNRGEEAITNFLQVFGHLSQPIYKEEGIQFVIINNSDIYTGISDAEISNFKFQISNSSQYKLTLVFAHKTPFHPQSAHVMGENSQTVAEQASRLVELMETSSVDGFFSGDLHFFAQFNSPSGNVKMTTIGAVNSARNFQGPRFAVVTVFDDYSWEVEDIEIR